MQAKTIIVAVAAVLLTTGAARTAITIATVPVGNPGNARDPTTAFGAVSYSYNIGEYDVTALQYTAFLNAVAATDTYGLYNTGMSSSPYGCGLAQSGSSGSYAYSVATEFANRPVNYVSFWDACRFANWLNNGQPTGAEGPGTTETGAYTLTPTGIADNTITRNTGAVWAVTSQNEWYKAAYYDPTLNGGDGGYWEFPTQSNSISTAEANYGNSVGHPTDVGAYPYPSCYGTFDQGGNVWQWNDVIINRAFRSLRGGSFSVDPLPWAADRSYTYPTLEHNDFGLRVSEVPEPASMAVIAWGAIGMLIRRRGLRR